MNVSYLAEFLTQLHPLTSQMYLPDATNGSDQTSQMVQITHPARLPDATKTRVIQSELWASLRRVRRSAFNVLRRGLASKTRPKLGSTFRELSAAERFEWEACFFTSATYTALEVRRMSKPQMVCWKPITTFRAHSFSFAVSITCGHSERNQRPDEAKPVRPCFFRAVQSDASSPLGLGVV